MTARHFIYHVLKAKIFKSKRKFIETKMVGRFDFTAHSSPPAFPNLIKQHRPPTGGGSSIPALKERSGLITNRLCLYLAATISIVLSGDRLRALKERWG